MNRRKEHWTKYNWGDWFKDEAVAQCRPATRGIWHDAYGRMLTAGTDRICGKLERLTHLLRASSIEIVQAAFDLAETNTAIVLLDGKPILEWREEMARKNLPEADWMANDMANSTLTLICRRLSRELHTSKIRAEVGRKGAAKRWQNHTKEISNALVNGSGSIGGGVGEDPELVTPRPKQPVPELLRIHKPTADAANRVLRAMMTKQGVSLPVTPEQVLCVCDALAVLQDASPPYSLAEAESACLGVVDYVWKLGADNKLWRENFNARTLFAPAKFTDFLAKAIRNGNYRPNRPAEKKAAQHPASPPSKPPTKLEILTAKLDLAKLMHNQTRIHELETEIKQLSEHPS